MASLKIMGRVYSISKPLQKWDVAIIMASL